MMKSCFLRVTTVLLASGFLASLAAHAQVINNPSDQELMYTTLTDKEGVTTSELYVTKGKVYIQNGQVAFGTGKHRLKNVDGRGQYIGVAPSQLVMYTMDKTWVLGFRVDEMVFHWNFDELRGNEMSLIVDILKIHDKTISSIVSENQQESVCTDIALKENRILLSGVSDIPFAPGRTYVTDQNAPTATDEDVVPSIQEKRNGKRELTILKDGTLASQDIMVHLTSPVSGELETFLRNTKLINQYKDRLMLLEIRGVGGERTSLLYFDKGQSIDFDDRGVPVSGKGKIRLEAINSEGQLLVGWLSAPNSPHYRKKVQSVNLEFVSTGTGTSQLELTELVAWLPAPDEKTDEKPNR